MSLNEGRDRSPGDTRPLPGPLSPSPRPLNEGRDRSPGDTRWAFLGSRHGGVRSTKAGTVVPATPVAVVHVHPGMTRSTKAGTVVPATLVRVENPSQCCDRSTKGTHTPLAQNPLHIYPIDHDP